MSTARHIATAGLALAVAGCSGMKIQTDYNPAAVPSMQAYQTYSWIPDTGPREDPELNNPILISRIESAVDAALAAKGYQKQASGGDFQVGWFADVDQRTDYTTVNSYYGGYGWGGWYGGGMGMGTSRTTAHNWEEGTLVLVIADGKSKELVWHGSATAEVGREGSPEQRQQRINTAVEKIFANFPPGQ
ncbi:MAG: DUF4136 domain-containing protein [Gemmatimonadota bacterium]|nr:MAG: DUF4136 domain-containing protein [Gemmatimonadota bacterium]